MAKNVFAEIGQKVKVIELNKRSDGGDIQDILNTMTGARSVSAQCSSRTIIVHWNA